MPDFHWNDGTDWVGEGGTFYQLKCDYRLVIDNLMDLTHETYVHAGSIGDEAITDTPFDVTHTDAHRDGDALDDRHRPAAVLGASSSASRATSTAGRSSISRRHPSSSATSASRSTGTGAPQGDRSQGVNGAFLAAITPETRDDLPLFLEFRPHLQDG